MEDVSLYSFNILLIINGFESKNIYYRNRILERSICIVDRSCLSTRHFWCTGQKDNARGWDALYETSGPCTVMYEGRGGIMVRIEFESG